MSAGAARVHRQQRRLAAEAGRGRGALTLLEVEHVARRCVDGHAGIALRAQRPHAALLLGAVDHRRAAAGHRDETGLARGGRAEGRAVEVGDDGVVVDALVAAGAGPAEVVRRVGLELVVVDCAQKRRRLTHDAHRNGAARKTGGPRLAGRGALWRYLRSFDFLPSQKLPQVVWNCAFHRSCGPAPLWCIGPSGCGTGWIFLLVPLGARGAVSEEVGRAGPAPVCAHHVPVMGGWRRPVRSWFVTATLVVPSACSRRRSKRRFTSTDSAPPQSAQRGTQGGWRREGRSRSAGR